MFFEDILENLNNQIEYFSKVLELSQEEKQSILDNDVDRVSEIVEQQKALYIKAQKEENKRLELIKNSKQFSGKEDVALGDIINICTDAKLKNGIIDARNRLLKVIQEQKYLDVVIDQLLSTNLEYYNFILTAVSSEITPNNMYNSSGGEAYTGKAGINILDSEV